MDFKHIRLENEEILLRPIQEEDIEQYRAIAYNSDLWLYTPTKVTEENLVNYIQAGVNDLNNEKRIMFSIIRKADSRIIGSTSIGNIDLKNSRVEIGWTWLANEFQGTGINKICKALLLEFCFEKLEIIRVEFKTDVNNEKSRKALKKIGAIEEGILRSHTLLNNGTRRNTIYYSILIDEWPTVKNTIFEDFFQKRNLE